MKRLLACALSAIPMLSAQIVSAAGFYLSEVGTPASLGTGGVANPTNTWGPDAAWTNPAGMTGLKNAAMVGGVQLALPKIEFDPDIAEAGGKDGGQAGDIAAIPSFFYATPLSNGFSFGFSVTAPLGGGLSYGDEFVGRYQVQEVSLQGVGFTPSLAYRVNDRLSIGGGVTVIYTTLEQEIALRQPGLPDGKVKFNDMNDVGYQALLGLTYQLTDRALLGLVYRSEADVELSGNLKFNNTPLSALGTRSLGIDWTNPQWAEAGLRYALNDATTLFLNAGWQQWSEFSENSLNFENGEVVKADRNWDDTWHAGVAAAHQRGNSVWSLGFSYDSSPVKDRNRTFDFPVDETWKLSASYSFERKDGLYFSLGSSLLMVGDAAIDQTAQGVRVTGDYESNLLWLVGGSLRYDF